MSCRQVRVALLAEHGEVRSFLADQFPECRAASAALWAERSQAADEEQDQGELWLPAEDVVWTILAGEYAHDV